MIFVIAVLIHTVWVFVPAAELKLIVLFGVTVIVPVVVPPPQPPVIVIVYVYGLPAVTDGEPLIVTTPPAHTPLTPVGSPVTVAPVAVVVV